MRLSNDELTLYISASPVGSDDADLYLATRASRSMAFGAPVRLTLSAPGAGDFNPTLPDDELTMIFDSRRGGSARRLYIATRMNKAAALGAPEPIASAGSPVQTDDDKQPFVTPDGSELWFSSNRAGSQGVNDIFQAAKINGQFSAAVINAELSSPRDDLHLILSADLLTVYLGSNRPGSFEYDIWRSQRSSVADRFPPPTLVTELQASGNQYPTWLSPDNCRLYIDTDAAGAGDDIFVAERQP